MALKSYNNFECKDILAGKILMYIFVEYNIWMYKYSISIREFFV